MTNHNNITFRNSYWSWIKIVVGPSEIVEISIQFHGSFELNRNEAEQFTGNSFRSYILQRCLSNNTNPSIAWAERHTDVLVEYDGEWWRIWSNDDLDTILRNLRAGPGYSVWSTSEWQLKLEHGYPIRRSQPSSSNPNCSNLISR